MRIMKLAAGLATGYVLGARAGREKYDQITAVARKVSARADVASAEPQVTRDRPEVDAPATPTAAASIEQLTPRISGDQTRRPRNRRGKKSGTSATPTGSDQGSALTTADLDLPAASTEADHLEQNMPVVDTREEPALTPTPLESDATDAREQRRAL